MHLHPTMGYLALALFPLVWGWLLDRLFGDPTSYHPIVYFGRLIGFGEKRLNRPPYQGAKGAVYNGSLVLLAGGILCLVEFVYLRSIPDGSPYIWVASLILGLFVWYMLSGTTLIREGEQVFEAADRSLDEGRRQVARIVGRDTDKLSDQEVRTAALETLSENLSDGVIAPLFWYMLFGLGGIAGYKMTNTQDSMIGYKHSRYRAYGCFSARLDDVLNYIPARLTAILMLLSVGRLDLLAKVWGHGKRHASPNSGYPEAALALVLGCRFGGPHDYFGQLVYKPYIGEGDKELTRDDLILAIRINRRAELMMLALTLAVRSLLFLLR